MGQGKVCKPWHSISASNWTHSCFAHRRSWDIHYDLQSLRDVFPVSGGLGLNLAHCYQIFYFMINLNLILWCAQVVYVPFSRLIHPCCFGARLQNCSLSCLCICGVLLYHLGLSPVWAHLLMAFSTDGQWHCIVREPEASFAKTEHNKLCPNSERIRKTPVRQGRAGNQLGVWHTAQGPETKEKVKEELTQMNISNQGVINLASF